MCLGHWGLEGWEIQGAAAQRKEALGRPIGACLLLDQLWGDAKETCNSGALSLEIRSLCLTGLTQPHPPTL